MSQPDGKLKFLIDTSSIVNIRDVYNDDAEIWVQFFRLVDAGELKTVRQAYEEIEKRFKDIFSRIKPYKKKLVLPDDINYAMPVTKEIRAIQLNHPTLYRATGNNNSADPFLIAASKHLNAVVITDEKRQGSGHQSKIPYVCRQRNVGCMNTEEFLEAIGCGHAKKTG